MSDAERKPEQEEPKPIETTKPNGLAVVDVRDASAEGVALMKTRVENQKQMLKIAISLTSPSQWTVFSGKDRNGVLRESVYPTGGAADTILRRAFGLTWGEKTVTVEDTPQGPESVCRAWIVQNGVPVEEFEGRRRMGGFIKTEADMRKGSVENMKSVAVRDLLGLRFRTPSELRDLGLDVSKLERRAEFQTHEKDESGIPVVPFGKNKGTPVTDLNERQLDWYIEAATQRHAELLADSANAKWAPKEKAWLDALRKEKVSRGQKPQAKQDEQKPQPGDEGYIDQIQAWDEPGSDG